MLEAPRQFDKGVDVALLRFANQSLVIHRHTLSPQGAGEGSLPLEGSEKILSGGASAGQIQEIW